MRELSEEVFDDLDDAKTILKDAAEKVLPALVKLECEAPSVLLQVLYSLHRGHVQFLAADYKSRIIEAYPHAFAKIRPPKLGKDGQPLKITNVGITEGEMNSTKVRSPTLITMMVREAELTLSPPPPHRRSCDPRRRHRQHPLKTSKRLASAPTPRHVRTRVTMTS